MRRLYLEGLRCTGELYGGRGSRRRAAHPNLTNFTSTDLGVLETPTRVTPWTLACDGELNDPPLRHRARAGDHSLNPRITMSQFMVEFGDDGRPSEADGRLDAPAFHRNHTPIWSVLAPFFQGRKGDALEVGSGTGQHVVTFARETPGVAWWPSDYNDKHLRSIAAWRHYAGLANVRPPLRIDLSHRTWGQDLPSAAFLAIVCVNVVHIAPWQVAEGLLSGAVRYLQPDGRLFMYGPFMRNGQHTAPSNAEFDASLRSSNVAWGVRDIEDLRSTAARGHLYISEIVEMPANNLMVIFQRRAAA
jgi:SAM-dependent methyltransferase